MEVFAKMQTKIRLNTRIWNNQSIKYFISIYYKSLYIKVIGMSIDQVVRTYKKVYASLS